jgi:Family of unknown function (DUF5675)
MNITVLRDTYTDNSVTGEMSVDGVFECFTLEPRSDRSQGKPYCIPSGTYVVLLKPSPHFGCTTPHLQNVPGFDEIEIHWGDFPKDTIGCTVVGQARTEDAVWQSKLAFDALMAKLAMAATISATYVGGPTT